MSFPSSYSAGMRVLMTLDVGGGVFTYTEALVRELCVRGAEVVLAVLGRPLARDQRTSLEDIPRLTVREHQASPDWMAWPWRDIDNAMWWLRDLEREIQPDVVHLNSYCYANASFRAPVVTVAHSSVRTWWRTVIGHSMPATYAADSARVVAGLNRTDLVVAPTAAMLKSVRRDHRYMGRGRVIPNGLDLAFPRVVKEPFFLAAGRYWDRAKNFELLARAAPHFAWPLFVAGETGAREGGAFGVPGMELLGPIPRHKLFDLLGHAAVFLHPARFEPFGLAPLEAALAGCALVLGDIPSLREVWGDGALFVSPDSPHSLIRAAERLAAEPELRAELAGAAFARGLRYSTTALGDRYLRVYRSVLRARRQQRSRTAHVLTERARSSIERSKGLLSHAAPT